MTVRIDTETINDVVRQTALRTGLPIEVVEKCWDGLASTLEEVLRAKYENWFQERGRA